MPAVILSRYLKLALALGFLLCAFGQPCSASSLAAQQKADSPANSNQEGRQSAAAAPASTEWNTTPDQAVEVEGLIRLDVVVRDQAGKPVAGLNREDFSLLDDGQLRKIVAFRAMTGRDRHPDARVSIILLIDTLGVPPAVATFEREQVDKFLRQNSGRLPYPVTIYSLEKGGLAVVGGPSLNGNALADAVVSERKPNSSLESSPSPSLLTQETSMVSSSLVSPSEPVDDDDNHLISADRTGLRAIATIAAIADGTPGRKLLLWVGPGLTGPLNSSENSGQYPKGFFERSINARGDQSRDDPVVLTFAPDKISPNDRKLIFNTVYWISTLLQRARVTLDVFSVGEDEDALPGLEVTQTQAAAAGLQARTIPFSDAWKPFLSDEPSAQQANMMELYKKVIALQSGGRVLPPKKDLANQINECIADAGTYYTMTFDPPPTSDADQYRALKVKLSQPGLTAYTSAAYYDQPFYDDNPDAHLKRVTVAQLEQIINAAHGGKEEERQISSVVLSERLDRTRWLVLDKKVHGSAARTALEKIAEESQFLPPPPDEISSAAAPDSAEQNRILTAAADYLSRVIPKLPDFFATRRTIQYGEAAGYSEFGKLIAPVPFHVQDRSNATVLYSHGSEVVEGLQLISSPRGQPLWTYGTFGPILRVVQDAIAHPNDLSWSRREENAGQRRAVFRYQVPLNRSLLAVQGCCLPGGNGATGYDIMPAYHGEISIDPSSGALLRVQVQEDLRTVAPADRSETVVAYGPVNIGGSTYILPLWSVDTLQSRQVLTLKEWNLKLQTWGTHTTELNDFTFDHYHKFAGSGHLLPGFTVVPSPATPQ
ncbi:MAG: VWA domain-containing protein [Acidobacteriaceae bacterium]